MATGTLLASATHIDPIIAAHVPSEFHLAEHEQPQIEPLTESDMAVLRLVAQSVENEHIFFLVTNVCKTSLKVD